MPLPASVIANKAKGQYGAPSYSRPLDHSIEDQLYGATTPNIVIQHEKAWHREAQEMALKGIQVNHIAEALGKHRNHVRQILAQPWARSRMTDRAKQSLQDEIKDVLENEVLPSIRVLASVRDNEEEVGATRVSAADKLLDRFLGKPNQPITTAEAKIDPTKLSTKEILERLAANGVLSPAVDAETESPEQLPKVG